MKLVIIDNRLKDIEVIINSLQIDTKYVILNYYGDTFNDILNKISKLNEIKFEYVALMAHGYILEEYKMLNKQIIPSVLKKVIQNDENLDSWAEIKVFWYNLILNYSIKYIDYLGCALLSDNNWKYVMDVFNKIDENTTFRASNNNTGNINGDWILETDGTDVKYLYFTDNIDKYEHSLYYFGYGYFNKSIISPKYTLPGSVHVWGSKYYGGIPYVVKDIALYDPNTDISVSGLDGNIINIHNTSSAFAALTDNGAVITWGINSFGGAQGIQNDFDNTNIDPTISSNLQSNVVKVFGTYESFAALKNNGSVITWGWDTNGGNSDIVKDKLTSNVITISTSILAFAALKNDGSVVTWGDEVSGGNSEPVKDQLNNVVSITSSLQAFAALKVNGSVVTWGLQDFGGNSDMVKDQLQSNIKKIVATHFSFAALKDDGSVVTWGNVLYGGNSYSLNLTNIIDLYSGYSSFTALKLDGSIVSWGMTGTTDQIVVNMELPIQAVSVYSSQDAWAAITSNGSVVAWGHPIRGGNLDSVAEYLQSDVISINSGLFTFSALKINGSIITWGRTITVDYEYGAEIPLIEPTNDKYINIYSTFRAYAAVTENGNVTAWGRGLIDVGDNQGGNNDLITDELYNITSIYNTEQAFAAIRYEQDIELENYVNTVLSFYPRLDKDKYKLDVIKNKANRNRILDNSIQVIGNKSININMIENQIYKVINYNGMLKIQELTGYFIIPIQDGERIEIEDILLVNYGNRLYQIINNELELICYDSNYKKMNINGYNLILYAGNILGYCAFDENSNQILNTITTTLQSITNISSLSTLSTTSSTSTTSSSSSTSETTNLVVNNYISKMMNTYIDNEYIIKQLQMIYRSYNLRKLDI
jgi:hypothetical protein